MRACACSERAWGAGPACPTPPPALLAPGRRPSLCPVGVGRRYKALAAGPSEGVPTRDERLSPFSRVYLATGEPGRGGQVLSLLPPPLLGE